MGKERRNGHAITLRFWYQAIESIQRGRSPITSPAQWALEDEVVDEDRWRFGRLYLLVSRCSGSQCGRVLHTGICALEHFGPRLPVMLFLYSVADEPADPGEACGQREPRR